MALANTVRIKTLVAIAFRAHNAHVLVVHFFFVNLAGRHVRILVIASTSAAHHASLAAVRHRWTALDKFAQESAGLTPSWRGLLRVPCNASPHPGFASLWPAPRSAP